MKMRNLLLVLVLLPHLVMADDYRRDGLKKVTSLRVDMQLFQVGSGRCDLETRSIEQMDQNKNKMRERIYAVLGSAGLKASNYDYRMGFPLLKFVVNSFPILVPPARLECVYTITAQVTVPATSRVTGGYVDGLVWEGDWNSGVRISQTEPVNLQFVVEERIESITKSFLLEWYKANRN